MQRDYAPDFCNNEKIWHKIMKRLTGTAGLFACGRRLVDAPPFAGSVLQKGDQPVGRPADRNGVPNHVDAEFRRKRYR